MLDNKIIEPSDTAYYNSPVFLIKKRDGCRRFIVDLRGINSLTVNCRILTKFYLIFYVKSLLYLSSRRTACTTSTVMTLTARAFSFFFISLHCCRQSNKDLLNLCPFYCNSYIMFRCKKTVCNHLKAVPVITSYEWL